MKGVLASPEYSGAESGMSQPSRAQSIPAVGSPDFRIKKLEQQLSIVTAERNDLAADVEALCMQSQGDIFSASNVLGDRISHIQKEANKLQCQVHATRTQMHSP